MNDKSRDGEHLLSASIADTAAAQPDQLTQAEQAAATLIAVGRLLEDAGYQPQCRILDAVRDVIANAAPPAPSVADAAGASIERHSDVLFGNYGALLEAEQWARRSGNDSTAEGLKALAHALSVIAKESGK